METLEIPSRDPGIPFLIGCRRWGLQALPWVFPGARKCVVYSTDAGLKSQLSSKIWSDNSFFSTNLRVFDTLTAYRLLCRFSRADDTVYCC